MVYPDSLPGYLEYRCGNSCRVTLPRRVVSFVGGSGDTDANEICPQIPLGASGWRLATDKDWRPMDTLPAEWLPFLNRARPSELDPRKALKHAD